MYFSPKYCFHQSGCENYDNYQVRASFYGCESGSVTNKIFYLNKLNNLLFIKLRT